MGEEPMLGNDELDAETELAQPDAPNVSDRFIGCLLGMAIGDALGAPGAGLDRAAVAAQLGTVTGYRPRRNAAGEVVSQAGEISANSELALCLVESMATSSGFVDPLTAGFRFARLLHGEHAHFLGVTTRAALERAGAR
jgi:ADP-ribosylglycohydrolase